MAEHIPGRDIETELMKEYVAFLNQPEFRKMEPVMWYLHVNLLLESSTVASKGEVVRGIVAGSGNPIMRMRLRLGPAPR